VVINVAGRAANAVDRAKDNEGQGCTDADVEVFHYAFPGDDSSAAAP
jgi:hypothetical protein